MLLFGNMSSAGLAGDDFPLGAGVLAGGGNPVGPFFQDGVGFFDREQADEVRYAELQALGGPVMAVDQQIAFHHGSVGSRDPQAGDDAGMIQANVRDVFDVNVGRIDGV